MPTIQLVNQENQRVGELGLSDKVFGAKIHSHIMWEAVQSHLASKRRGTASAKTRGEVSGGGAKPWRQKGTGRARAGSNRSPLWEKGGVIFGPKPRDYTWELPKKIRRQALRSALSAKLRDGQIVVLDQLTLPAIKTKALLQMLKNLKLAGRITCVVGKPNPNLKLSGRNLKYLRILNPENVNTYDVLDCDHLLLTREAVIKIEENLNQ